MIKSFFVLFCAIVFLPACNRSLNPRGQEEILPAVKLKPFGRCEIVDNNQLSLISSAANFGVSFSGDEVKLYVTVPGHSGHNYLQYELDGVYQKRIKISEGLVEPVIIRTQKKGLHTLWIYKATEAHSGPLLIEKIAGKKLLALERPTLPLIEFIGNSITCGAAADFSEIPCDSGEYKDHHNAYLSYGPRLARALNVNFIMNCVSGIGIYRNWNSDGPAMPQVYDKIDFQENNSKTWNATPYKPSVVSIALGTNDFSDGDGKKARLAFDSTRFVQQYILFIKMIKEKNPEAQVILLSSPMLNGPKRTLLQNCLSTIKIETDYFYPNQKPVKLFFFKPMQASGCSGHPSVEDHALLEKELEPFFRSFFTNK